MIYEHLTQNADNGDPAKVKAHSSPCLFDTTSLTVDTRERHAPGDPKRIVPGLKERSSQYTTRQAIPPVEVRSSEETAFGCSVTGHYLPNKTDQITRIFVESYAAIWSSKTANGNRTGSN